MSLLKTEMALVARSAEAALDRFLSPLPGTAARLSAAMRWGTLGGGKRLRPFLAVAVADMFDVPRDRSVRAGCAVEMIHCYSLVHDDLPAMDDSDLRRGRMSVHKKYDDATAILAGDALLTLAFEILADAQTHPDAGVRCSLVGELARAAGGAGMVGGQMTDMYAAHGDFDLDAVAALQKLKTGALIRFPAIAGGLLGGAGTEDIDALDAYAADLGLAFQIVDDILDVTGEASSLGKPAGQDEQMNKATYVGLLGPDGARQKAAGLIERSAGHLARFGGRAALLAELADFVLFRRS